MSSLIEQNVKRVLLKVHELNYKTVIPRRLIEDCKVEIEEEYMMLADHLLYSIKTYLASETKVYKYVAKREKVPVNWWEHLKHEKAPIWFINRYPVKYRNVDTLVKSTTHVKVCPHIDIPSNGREHLEFFLKE